MAATPVATSMFSMASRLFSTVDMIDRSARFTTLRSSLYGLEGLVRDNRVEVQSSLAHLREACCRGAFVVLGAVLSSDPLLRLMLLAPRGQADKSRWARILSENHLAQSRPVTGPRRVDGQSSSCRRAAAAPQARRYSPNACETAATRSSSLMSLLTSIAGRPNRFVSVRRRSVNMWSRSNRF
jgi:hypothetical protein